MTATLEKPAVSADPKTRLYTIPCGSGFTCLGFDVAEGYIEALARKAGAGYIRSENIGTLAHYRDARRAQEEWAKRFSECTYFANGTNPSVAGELERLRRSSTRVRIVYGDTETGKSWGEENDVIGTIGRSCGRIKIPLLIHTSRSFGGGALLTACIIGIRVACKDGQWLYKHPSLDFGKYEIEEASAALKADGYTSSVRRDGANVANFKGEARAIRYVEFMKCERFAK